MVFISLPILKPKLNQSYYNTCYIWFCIVMPILYIVASMGFFNLAEQGEFFLTNEATDRA